MEIFKLEDDILARLEMVLGFWNNQIGLVFSLLRQSPVSFKGGGPWAVVENLQPLFVGVGSGLVVLFFAIGFCAESIDIKNEFRFEAMLRMLIRLGVEQWLVANKTLVFRSSGYREMVSEIRVKEDVEKRVAVRKRKEERKWRRKEGMKRTVYDVEEIQNIFRRKRYTMKV